MNSMRKDYNNWKNYEKKSRIRLLDKSRGRDIITSTSTRRPSMNKWTLRKSWVRDKTMRNNLPVDQVFWVWRAWKRRFYLIVWAIRQAIKNKWRNTNYNNLFPSKNLFKSMKMNVYLILLILAIAENVKG